jgi:hypothetical protein
LIGCYRITGAKDVSNYVMALGFVLALFPDPVIAEATSPSTGIQTTAKFAVWPPNPGELKAYCDAIVDRERHIAHQDLPPDFKPRPYSRYFDHPDQFAPSPADRARVAAALAAFKSAIKPMEQPPRRQWHSPTDAELLAHYGKRPSIAPIPFE